jgi:hypothetical protein
MRNLAGTVGQPLEDSMKAIINSKANVNTYVCNSSVTIWNKNTIDYTTLPAIQVDITRESKKVGQQATIVISNNNKNSFYDIRYYNPYRGTHGYTQNDLEHVIIPNTLIFVKSGYGAYTTTVFRGYIDQVQINDKENTITIQCRDIGRNIIDRTVCTQFTKHTGYKRLEDTTPCRFDYSNVNGATLVVKNHAKTVTYSSSTDYIFGNNAIARRSGSTMASGESFYMEYETTLVDGDYQREYYLEYPIEANTVIYYLTSSDITVDLCYVAKDLLMRAGISSGNIYIEATGSTLDDFEFSFEGTYFEALQQLCDITGSDLWTDELGNVFFYNKESTNILSYYDGYKTMTGVTKYTLDHIQVIKESFLVQNSGKTITYTQDVDYTIDESDNTICRIVTGSMPSGNSFYIRYYTCDFVFREGYTIKDAPTIIDYNELPGTYILYNEEEGIETRIYPSTLWDGVVIPIDKVIREREYKCKDESSLAVAALKNVTNLLRQYISCDLNVVAVPWLQVRDKIFINIKGTIRGIYEVIGFTYSIDDTGIINQKIKCCYIYSF